METRGGNINVEKKRSRSVEKRGKCWSDKHLAIW